MFKSNNASSREYITHVFFFILLKNSLAPIPARTDIEKVKPTDAVRKLRVDHYNKIMALTKDTELKYQDKLKVTVVENPFLEEMEAKWKLLERREAAEMTVDKMAPNLTDEARERKIQLLLEM